MQASSQSEEDSSRSQISSSSVSVQELKENTPLTKKDGVLKRMWSNSMAKSSGNLIEQLEENKEQ